MKTIICAGVGAILLLGCGQSAEYGRLDAVVSPSAEESLSIANPNEPSAGSEARFAGVTSEGAVAPPGAADRKIIYTATIELIVEDFARADARVRALIKQFDGYLATYRKVGRKASSSPDGGSYAFPSTDISRFSTRSSPWESRSPGNLTPRT